MSLRLRVLAALVVIAGVMGIGAFTLARTTRSNLEARLDSQLDSAGELVRNFNFDDRGPGGSNRPGAPPGAGTPDLSQIHQLSTLYLGYIGTDGVLQTLFVPDLSGAGRPDPSGDGAPLPTIDVNVAQQEAAHDGTYTVDSSAGGVRFRVRVQEVGRNEVVIVALPMDSVDRSMSKLVRLELLVFGISGLVLVLVGWWVIHLGVRPLKSMTTAASAIASGDLSSRVPVGLSSTEAGELGTALNMMLDRIEAAFDERIRTQQRLQRFVADASHELRTPLATIRGYAELHRRGGLASPEGLADAMWRTEQEAVRMGALVDDLLLLAKLDEGRPTLRDPVDVERLALDAAHDAHARDPERLVRADVPAGLVVPGDEDRLRQVLANLVSNAIVHTPRGTPIEIAAWRACEHVELDVVDHGDGVPADVADSAFERFVRADPSRSRDRGGSGLGLAIVRSIVEAHGGSVRLATTPGGGTTVVVLLPAGAGAGQAASAVDAVDAVGAVDAVAPVTR